MTVSSTVDRVAYSLNGATTNFAVPFYWLEDADLLVTHVTFDTSGSATVTTLTLNSDYTVSGAGNPTGGSITTSTALSAGNGDQIIIKRNLSAVQPTSYPPNTPFPSSSHEQALDRLTMLVQQLSEQNSRQFTIADTGNYPDTTFPEYQASSLIGWDVSTQRLINTGPSAGAGTISDLNIAANAAIAATKINFTQPSTAQFFTQNGAVINRFNDRIFLGGATENDGAFPTVTKDWLTEFYDSNGYTLGYTLNGQFSVLSTDSSASSEMVVSGVQSLNFPGNGAYGTAFYGVGVNNGTAHTSMGVNAFYGEVHNVVSNLNSAYVCEFDTRTLADPSNPTPYLQGTVVGIQMASGCGTTGVTFTASISGTTLTVTTITFALPYGSNPNSYQIQVGSKLYGVGIPSGTTVTALGTGTGGTGTYTISTSLTVASETMVATDQYDASCAFQIEANPVKFKVGINFGSTSITGCDGVTGAGTAIAFALGHQCNWYNSSGAIIGRIVSYATDQSNSGEIQFNDNGIELRSFNTGGGAISYFSGVANAVNWLTHSNSVSGSPVVVGTNGSDASIDIRLQTKGTGAVWLGGYTTSAPTATGYITVKDSNGTVRKLLCA